MKRIVFLLVALLVLAGCSSDMYKSGYTASGEGVRPAELHKTTTFKTDDDLNVVVKLNSHKRTLPVRATFVGPDGTAYPTDALEAEETVGEVTLGLDWEAMGSLPWIAGDWKAEVYVEDKKVDTLKFTVEAATTPPQG